MMTAVRGPRGVRSWFAGMLLPALVAIATPAVAQQQPAQPAAPAAGAPAAAPAQPQVVNSETFGDWIYGCIQPQGATALTCTIAQQLSNSQNGQTIFLWRMMQDGKGGILSEWQTVTGIMVIQGIMLDAGTPQPIRVPFQLCTTTGCAATATLAPDFLESLSKAQKATATITLIDGRNININISVNGLNNALAKLRAG